MVFTLDVAIAELRNFRPGEHTGIVLFRPHTLGPLAVNRFVVDFVNAQNLEYFIHSMVIVEPNRICIRRPTSSARQDIGQHIDDVADGRQIVDPI
jgi:hypothetical protein